MPLVCVEDFEQEARFKLDRNAWNYYSSGANLEQTLRDNVNAYQRYLIRPRMLRDVRQLDLKTRVLGSEINFPVCVSPTAMQCMAHHDGETATARACSRLGSCMILSSWSTRSLEEVAKASGSDGLRWFQLYIYNDRELTLQLVKRAEAAGYRALALTIDTPELGRRLNDVRHNFTLPPHLRLANFSADLAQASLGGEQSGSALFHYTRSLINSSLTWESVDWLRSVTNLPIVLKGILTAEDAREALRHDIQGILVSNHGARQLDGVPATIDALSEVVREVEGRVEVYLDGGVRRGTDVLKALALGATAVFVGRPVLWGLACKGEDGVCSVLSLLKEELRQAMALSGCAKVSDITPELVVHQTHYTHPQHKHKQSCRAKL